MRRRIPIIPTFRKLRQEAHGFRTSLEHTELVQGQPGLIVKPQPKTQTFELSVCAASPLPLLCRRLLGLAVCAACSLLSAVGCCWVCFCFALLGINPRSWCLPLSGFSASENSSPKCLLFTGLISSLHSQLSPLFTLFSTKATRF